MSQQLLRVEQVAELLSVSRVTVYRRLKDDPSFPRARQAGPNSVRWLATEIDDWIENLQPAHEEI